VRSDDKRRARLNVIAHILSRLPYEDVPREKVKLPKRRVSADARKTAHPVKQVPEVH
jgi:hypothetical protein